MLDDYAGQLGLIDVVRERADADRFRRALNIKTADLNILVGTLSGGNQQKVLLAKWLNTGPRILIVDEPTRGYRHRRQGRGSPHSTRSGRQGCCDRHHLVRSARGFVFGRPGSGDAPRVISSANSTATRRRKNPSCSLQWVRRPPGKLRNMSALIERLGTNWVRILALLVVLIGIILFFSSQIDNYLNARLFNRISTSVAIIAIIAVGQAIVVLTRNIDLSVGSIVGCVAYFVGGLLATYPGIPAVLVPFIAMGIGAGFGAVNGFLVSRLKLPAIIVTLATLAIFRSILVESSDGASITTGSLPQWLIEFARTNAFTIGDFRFRWIVIIAVIVVIAAACLSDPDFVQGGSSMPWGPTPMPPSLPELMYGAR